MAEIILMKVLHTIPGLDISSGGPSTSIYNLLKGLRAVKTVAKSTSLATLPPLSIWTFTETPYFYPILWVNVLGSVV